MVLYTHLGINNRPVGGRSSETWSHPMMMMMLIIIIIIIIIINNNISDNTAERE
jgi:hypothetical protein